MFKSKIKVLCTLGPSTTNKNFLNFANGKINLLRLNMSHVEIKKLSKTINFIKQHTKIPICIDTEGAQIRTKIKKDIFYKKNKIIKLTPFEKGNFNFYPPDVFEKIKVGDVLLIGFDNLKAKVIKKKSLKFKYIKK